MKLRDKKVIWTSNLSKDVSRREGRKLPKKNVFSQKSMPSHPWSKEGYIVINYDGPKKEILLLLAEKIDENRLH